MLLMGGLAQVACGELDIYQVKARYIHNFIKYITWPAQGQPANAFEIALMDAPPLKAALEDVVRAKDWQGKPIKTSSLTAAEGTPTFQVVYIRETNREKVEGILQILDKATLTIGEGPSFLARGGMIEFNILEGKVHFSVNLRALRAAGFGVDAKLLSAAEEVRK